MRANAKQHDDRDELARQLAESRRHAARLGAELDRVMDVVSTHAPELIPQLAEEVTS